MRELEFPLEELPPNNPTMQPVSKNMAVSEKWTVQTWYHNQSRRFEATGKRKLEVTTTVLAQTKQGD